MKGNMSQSRNADAFENFVPKTRKINGQTLDNDVQIDNVASADKLKTARAISLSGAVTSTPKAFDGSGNVDIPITAVKESLVEWGGDNLAYRLSPVDVAMLPELNANRLAFIPDNDVKFERSEDAGVTWVDVSSDFDGTMLCTHAISFGNGNTVDNKSVYRQQRITIDCLNSDIHGELAKIMMEINTNGAGSCFCKVEFGDNSEDTVWASITTARIAGWTGWNSINVDHAKIGSTATNRYVRLTFGFSSLDDAYPCDLKIRRLRFICSAFHGTGASAMSQYGTIYRIDREQTVTFPKNLTIQGNTLKIGSTTLTETQLKALLALLT